MTDAPYIKVSEVMTPSVRTVDALATVRDALKILDEANVSSLVIERRNDADELSIITIFDIAREVIAEKRSPNRVNVYEIMTKPVLTLDRDMDIKYAIRMLVRYGATRGVVIDHDRTLMGITTLRDMVVRYAHVEEDET